MYLTALIVLPVANPNDPDEIGFGDIIPAYTDSALEPDHDMAQNIMTIVLQPWQKVFTNSLLPPSPALTASTAPDAGLIRHETTYAPKKGYDRGWD
jgi:hypothetical protein